MPIYANSPAARITVLTVLSLFVVADVVGNILVCLVVLRNRSMRTAMNLILVNLALCDITVAAGMTSKYILTELISHPTGDFGKYLCTFITSGNLTWVGGLASVFCLVSLSYERYSAIVNPYNIHKRITKRKAVWFSVASWIASIIICVPEFIGYDYHKTRQGCFQKWPFPWLPKAYSMFWLFVVGIIPISLMVFFYSRIVNTLWFQSKGDHELAQQAVLRYRKSVTKMLIVISVIYIIGWVPTLCVFVLVFWSKAFQAGQVIGAVTAILVVFNSAVNPYAYALQSKEFRKRLKNYIFCCQCRLVVFPVSDSSTQHSAAFNQTHVNNAFVTPDQDIQLQSYNKRRRTFLKKDG